MKRTEIIMGMPVTVEITDRFVTDADLEYIFSYFKKIDEQFSPYKETSEVSRLNRKEVNESSCSEEMKEILKLAEKTKQETRGYFDVWNNNVFNPSGIVKGWAIYEASKILDDKGFKNFYVDAGGDIEVRGKNEDGDLWRIGIRNPFDMHAIIKTLAVTDCGVATSGTYVRGQHIYDPHEPEKELKDMVSVTVIGPNVLEADRFATAAFAMEEKGIVFISAIPHLAGYSVDSKGTATMTNNFDSFVLK